MHPLDLPAGEQSMMVTVYVEQHLPNGTLGHSIRWFLRFEELAMLIFGVDNKHREIDEHPGVGL